MSAAAPLPTLLVIPTGIGWGADVNEAALRAHPVKGREAGAR